MTSADISALPTYDDDGRLLAVIEAVQGSANKLKFEPRFGAFILHKVLPAGSVFPFDFGFVPGTLGADGDPLDVVVIMDEPVPPGVVVPCRLLGVVKATQRASQAGRGMRGVRNDRLIAVADKTHRCEHYRSLRDVGLHVIGQIEAFFVFYNDQLGKRFTPIGRSGVAEARLLVAEGRERLARAL